MALHHPAEITGYRDSNFFDNLTTCRTSSVHPCIPHLQESSYEPPRFLPVGFLKDDVYEHNPRTIAELKAAITRRIRTVTPDECSRVIDNFVTEFSFAYREDDEIWNIFYN